MALSFASGPQAPKTHVLVFQVLVDAVLGALDTQTRLFDAAERGLGGGHDALVHADYPHLQGLGHPPDLTGVLREEVT